MRKSWLTLGGSVVSLLAVVSLYFNTEQQPPETNLPVPFQAFLPQTILNSLASPDTSSEANHWAMPAYQDYIAAWQDKHATITLDQADLTEHQAAVEEDSPANELELPDSYGLVHNTPLLITHLRQGLASLSDRPEELRGQSFALRPRLFAVSFRPSDRSSIERYANRQHSSEGVLEFKYIDPNTIELLSGFRRVLIDDIAAAEGDLLTPDSKAALTGEGLPRAGLEVAPGGGQYWIEDPNAALW